MVGVAPSHAVGIHVVILPMGGESCSLLPLLHRHGVDNRKKKIQVK